ncbi:MAG: hypothetical protein LBT26_06530 [Clostridiales Family XIII bacterium]|jgi:hypothetical protein|nr:hypothetical protein [Clostridiales Family XIII bacterium]
MPFENFDHILYMQIHVANLYRKAHDMTIEDFLELDRKTGLLPFVADAYEPFHLTGDPGILEEVDDYVRGALA